LNAHGDKYVKICIISIKLYLKNINVDFVIYFIKFHFIYVKKS